MAEIRYAVVPGDVISASDGQRHSVSAVRLMSLYDVSPSECLILDEGEHPSIFSSRTRGLLVLRPRDSGNYTLPAEPELK